MKETMVTINCSFRERIRLLQLVGSFPSAGTPQLRECSRILDVLIPTVEESAAVDLVIDVAKDAITWSDDKLKALAPAYDLSFENSTATLLVAVLDKATLHPLADGWVVKLVDSINDQLQRK
jgi:hypothetical protein